MCYNSGLRLLRRLQSRCCWSSSPLSSLLEPPSLPLRCPVHMVSTLVLTAGKRTQVLPIRTLHSVFSSQWLYSFMMRCTKRKRAKGKLFFIGIQPRKNKASQTLHKFINSKFTNIAFMKSK